jgi:hypothetical protein
MQLGSILAMSLFWVLPIVVLWWMVRTLNAIRIDVHRIADEVTVTKDAVGP